MASRSRRRWCSAAITRAGSGLGRELALGYAAQGCIVFGTATWPAEVQELRTASGGRVSLAVSDVTKFTKGRIWAEGVSDALDGAGLDLLINNPHLIPQSPLEAVSVDMARHVFEQNLVGAVSTINAFLPALRRSRGRIVQIIDASLTASPSFCGLAAASNAALEALLCAYRADLEPFGVHVTTIVLGRIEGGYASTNFDDLRSTAKDMSPEQRELYGKRLAALAKDRDGHPSTALGAQDAAAQLIALLDQKPVPSRAPIGPGSSQNPIDHPSPGMPPDPAGSR